MCGVELGYSGSMANEYQNLSRVGKTLAVFIGSFLLIVAVAVLLMVVL